MADVRLCACGCTRWFEPTRPWHVFATAECRFRGWSKRWRRKKPATFMTRAASTARTRRMPKGRAGMAHNALQRIPKRHGSTVLVSVASIGGALECLAKRRPAFFLKLAKSTQPRVAVLPVAAD